MKCKRKIIAIILVICMLFMISAVSAADSSDDAVSIADVDENAVSAEVANDNLTMKNDVEILGETDGGTYAELSDKITNPSGTTVDLWNNYTFNESSSAISISTANLVIDGHGVTTIDAKGYSSIFEIIGTSQQPIAGVTFKNIIFKNGYDADYSGAIYAYYADNLKIENCTFISNHGSVGALYVYYCNGAKISNSTFINNFGSNYGAIQFMYYQGSIDRCIFVNNTGTTASAIYWAVFWKDGNISNSIFINNTGTNDVYYNSNYASNYKNNLHADYNWWGQTTDNYESSIPKVTSNLVVNNYYVLDLELTDDGATASLNKLYNGVSLIKNSNYALPSIKLNVSGTNITVPQSVELKNGEANIDFVKTDKYSLTVDYNGVSLSKIVVPTSFSALKDLINNAGEDTVTLIDDYKYDSSKDSGLQNGIEIDRSITIEGQGHIIDAEKLSNIFYFVDNDMNKNLILKNIIFTNATGNNGAAVYFKGNKIEVINCTFINNEANGQGDALYVVSNSNENKVSKTIFINNTGSNSVIYLDENVGANISNSIFIGNDDEKTIIGSSNVIADYNWWTNTAENYNVNIANVSGVTVNRWFFLKIDADAGVTSTATISLNNVYSSDGNSTYGDYSLQSIKLNLGGSNSGVSSKTVTLDEHGNATFSFTMIKTTATLTASYEDIKTTKNLEYVIVCDGSFKELYDLIWFNQNGVLELEHDFAFIEGVDTITGGIYTTKDLTINGNGFTIDAKGKAAIFWFDGNNVVLNNITFKNAVSDYGAAIYHSANSLTANYCTFLFNYADYGGAVYNYGGTNHFLNCTFGNNSGDRCGAVYVNSGTTDLTNCTFGNNSATTAGAVYSYGATVSFINSTFENNSATNAGVSYNYCSYLTFDKCTFKNNTANQGAVSYATSYSDKFTNSLIINNKAKTGAVFYITGNNAEVNKCILINNSASTALIYSTSGNTVKNSILLNNTGTYILNSNYPQQIVADYNWFGNNMTDYNVRPNLPTSLSLNNWYYLDLDTSTKNLAKLSLKLTDGTQDIQYDPNLPNINLTIENENLTIQNNVTLKSGKADVPYTFSQDNVSGYLKFKQTAAEVSAEVKMGDFDLLQKLINDNDDVFELTRDFTYDISDTITEGILIDKRITINGNGYTIDAKGKSRIFYITGNQVTINNVTLKNGKSEGEGAAVYWSGNDGTLKSSVIANNTGTSAVYWDATGGDINNCVILNNSGTDIISTTSDLKVYYNWFGNNASNYNSDAPNVVGLTLNNWYFLDIELSSSNAIITLNNLYKVADDEIETNVENVLPDVNITLTGENITVQNNLIINKGSANCLITPQNKDLSLKASFMDASYTKIPSFTQGDFAILQGWINNNGSDSVIKLNRNFTYIPGLDSGNTGISISQSNITIDGNGYTINANGKSRIFNVQGGAENLTIKNVILMNGYNNDGGAIYWAGADNGTINNTLFKNNIATNGAAIYSKDGSNKKIVYSEFINNTALTSGGSIYIYDTQNDDSLLIFNSTFKNNVAKSNGGVIYIQQSNIVDITKSDFINNSAISSSGAVNGGVIYSAYGTNDLNIDNSNFVNNYVKTTGSSKTGYGGVIYWSTSDKTLSISNSNFTNNSAMDTTSYGRGGVIYADKAATGNIINSTFSNNRAKTDGGVFRASGGFKGNFDNCSFLNNYINGRSSAGAVIHGYSSSTVTTVSNSIFLNNTRFNYYGTSRELNVAYMASSSTSTFDYCWFGNVGNNYDGQGMESGNGITINNRLSLSSIHDEFMAVGEDKEIKFIFQYFDNGSTKIYDSSKLPKVNLTLSSVNGSLDKNSASIDETILFNADHFGNTSITAKYNTVELTEIMYAKDKPTITVDPIVIHVGESIGVNVIEKIPSDADLTFSSIAGDEFILVAANGYVEGLKEGSSTLYIEYKGNDDYVPITVEVPVTVIRYDTEINVKIDGTSVDSLNVEWAADPQGIVLSFSTDDSNPQYDEFGLKFKSSDEGVANFTTSPTMITFGSAGTANITFYFEGSNRYNACEKNITVTVNKVASSVSFSNEIVFDYGGSNTTALTVVGGSVDEANIAVVGHPEAVISLEGNLITVSNLTVGPYTLKVITTPDNNHTSVSNTTTITVSKAASDVTVPDREFVFGQSVEIAVVPVNTTGANVSAVVLDSGNSVGVVSVSNNVITVTGLNAGNYTLSVTTIVDDTYYKSTTQTAWLNITKAASDVTVPEKEFVYGAAVEIAVIPVNTTGDNVSAVVLDSVDNEVGVVSVSGNVISVAGLNVGNYTLKVTTMVDGNHKDVTRTAWLNITQAGSDVTVPDSVFVYANSYSIKVDPVNSTNGEVTAVVLDSNGNAVSGVSISVLKDVITIINLDVGNYTLNVTTNVDGNHYAVTKSGNLNITQAASDATVPQNTTVSYGGSKPVKVLYLENATGVTAAIYQNGNKIKDLEVNNNVNIIVDASNVDNGTYELVVTTVPKNDNYYAVNKTGILLVNKNTEYDFGYEYKSLTITRGENVTVRGYSRVGGLTGNVTFYDMSDNNNSLGTANINEWFNITDLTVGIHYINASYEGNGNYASKWVEFTIIVNKISKNNFKINISPNPYTYGDSIRVNATIDPTDATGNVSFYISGKNYANITINTTINTTIIINNLPAGHYTITANYSGDTTYENDTTFSQFDVYKAQSSVEIDKITSGIYSQDVVVVFTNSTPISVNVQSKKDITINLNETNYNGIIINSNKVIIKSLNASDYTITIKTLEDENHKSNSISMDFTVEQAGSDVYVPNMEFVYGESVKVTVSPVNTTGDNVSAVVLGSDNNEVGVTSVDNNVITVTGLGVGNYTLKVTTKVDGNHRNVTRTAWLNITEASSDVVVPGKEFVYGVAVEIAVIPVNTTGDNVSAVVLDSVDNEVGVVSVSGNVISITGLGVGNYTLKVTTKVDGNHSSVNKTAWLNITQAGSDVTVPDSVFVYANSYSIKVDPVNSTNGEVTAVVLDSNGNAVSGVSISVLHDVITITNLNFGNYTLNVTTNVTGNYSAVTRSGSLNITKAGSIVTISTEPVTYNNTVILKINGLNTTGVGKIEIVDRDTGDPVEFTNVTKELIVEINGLDAGNYTVKITNRVDGNHIENFTTHEIEVIKAPSYVSVKDASEVYGNIINITVDFENATNVTFTVKYTNGTMIYEGVSVDKTIIIPKNELSVNDYAVEVVTNVDKNHYSNTTEFKLSITPAGSTVLINDGNPVNVVYSDTIIIKVDGINQTGFNNFTVYDINNTKINFGSDSGFFGNELVLHGLNVGVYTLEVYNLVDSNHIENSSKATVNITKAPSSVESADISKVYGKDISVDITSVNATNVNMVVFDEDNVYFNQTVNNNTKVPLSDLAAGNYNINLTTIVDGNHIKAFEQYSLTISKAASGVAIDDIVNVTYNANTLIRINVTNATEVYWVIENDTGIVYNDTGSDNIIRALDAGNYTITVINKDSQNYTGSSATKEFSVFKAGSTIDAKANSTLYGINATVFVSFVNASSVDLLVKNLAGETVFITTISADDDVVLPILAAGNYTVDLSNDVDSNHKSTSKQIELSVFKAPTSVAIDEIADVTYNASTEISFTVANQTEVSWTITNRDTGAEIKRTGNSSISMVFAAGNYTFAVTNRGNENYTESTDSKDFIVFKAGSVVDGDVDPIDYGVNATLSVSFINASSVYITVKNQNGDTVYNEVILTGGDISLPVLDVGEYSVSLTANVDGNHTASSRDTTFSVNYASSEVLVNGTEVIYGDDVVLEVGGENTTGIAKIEIFIYGTQNAVAFTNVTDENRTTISGLSAGRYMVRITNLVDKNHKEDVAICTVNIIKANSTVGADDVSGVYGEDISVNIQSVNATGVSIVVVDEDNNVVYSNRTDKNGAVALPKLAVGEYEVRLTTNVDANHSSAKHTSKIVITQSTSLVDADDLTITYGESASVEVTSENNTKISYIIYDENNKEVGQGEITQGDNIEITAEKLASGNYTVALTGSGDKNHSSSNAEFKLTVSRASSLVSADDVSADYGDEITLNIQSQNATEVMITVRNAENEIVYSNVTDNDHIAIEILDAGNYTVELVAVVDDNHTQSTNSAKITVSKVSSSVRASDVSVDYGSEVSLDVTSSDALSVDYVVRSSNGTVVKEGNVKDRIELGILDAGNYTVELTTVVDGNHISASNTSKIAVAKVSSSVSASDVEVSYGESVVVEITSSNALSVDFVVKSLNGTVVKEGNANDVIDLGILDAGSYTVELTTVVDGNHVSASNTSGIAVAKVSSSLSASDVEVTYGEDVIVEVTSSNALSVDYVIKSINGTVVKEGNVNETIDLGILDAGSYAVELTTVVDANHNANTTNSIITVNKAETTITVENANLTMDIGNDTLINATINPTEAGKLTYTTNDTSVVTVSDGVITAVGEGTAKVTVTYAGSANYLPSGAEIIVNVNPVEAEINLTEDDLELIVDDTFNLRDIISKTGAGKLKFTTSDPSVVVVDDEGVMKVVGSGSAKITVYLVDDKGNVIGENRTVTVTVNRIPTEIDVIGVLNIRSDAADEDLKATLTPAVGNLTYSSSNPSVVSVKDGLITANGAGTAIITVSYAGDDMYLPSERNVTVTVERIASQITVNDTFTVLVDGQISLDAVLNHPGNLIYTSGSNIITVDAEGNVKGLSSGQAKITVSFAQDEKYLQAERTVTVTVNRAPSRITVNDTFEINVDETLNLAAIIAPSGELKYTVSNPDVISVDANGNVRGLIGGESQVIITFEGNDKYLPSNASAKVTVNRLPTTITVDNTVTVRVGETSSINAVLNHAGDMTYTLNGKTVSIDDKGNIIGLSQGTSLVTVSFAGDDKYLAADATVHVKVTKISAGDKEISTSVDMDGKVTIAVDLPDDAKGDVLITVGGRNYTVPVGNGSAALEIDDLPSGDYSVGVTYLGDDKYSGFTKNPSIRVPVIKLDENEDVTMRYGDGSVFVIRLTSDGRPMVNRTISIVMNNENTYYRVTNESGYAVLRLGMVPDRYDVVSSYGKVNVSNKLTVKHLLKVKNTKYSKSSGKTLKVKVTLRKLNGKYLKRQKVKIKFKGKIYKAKTNKKGVAYVKIPAKVLNKLKVGKKYKFKAGYKKDKVKKTIKILG